MLTPEWIPHHRSSDGELLGWIRPEGEGFVAVSLLADELSDEVDWITAEEALDEQGLAWLAEAWLLNREGRDIQVRVVEVSPDRIDDRGAVQRGRIRVKTDDFGAIDVPYETIELPWPPPAELRLRDSGSTSAMHTAAVKIPGMTRTEARESER